MVWTRQHEEILVREIFTYERKKADEEKATGIAPDEPTEFENALEDIVAKFEEIELLTLKEREENNHAAEKERETATEMRKQCMETHSESAKRKMEEPASDSSDSKVKQKRRTGDDTLSFMREKMNIDRALKEKELDIAAKREENLQKMLDQQQKQNQAMLQLLMARNQDNQ